jgi:pyruvate dehydrogenase E2 component (dihydrolipoamide acetyltransferase)
LVTAVVMPQLGLEVEEGVVVDVLAAVGATVSRDDVLVELDTDKARTEVVAPSDGVVHAVHVETGDTVAVGAPLVDLMVEGETVEVPAPAAAAPPTPHVTPAAAPAPAPARLRAAPVARRAAERLGIDLAALSGTGPRGRITLRDVEHAAADGHADDDAVTPLTPLRRAIARRMTASQRIPQYELQRDVDVRHLLAQKDALAAAAPDARVGLSDLLLQAIAETVVRHRDLATALVEDDGGDPAGLRALPAGDIGLAVATDRGLVVPVVRAVDTLGAAATARERRRLVEAARRGALSLEEMRGGTTTLSNLAGFGVDRFKAMVNPGQSAIVAVGRTTDRVVPRGRGIDVVAMLTITMTFDHRVVDGAVGAAALAGLAELLEGAMTWRP